MNPMRQIWDYWALLVVSSFSIFEAWGYWQFGFAGTLSYQIRQWSTMHPIMPYVLICTAAALAYHLWGAK